MVTLQKVHGSENSFFLLDETQLKQPLSTSQLAAFPLGTSSMRLIVFS
ncbi:hypothetical protein ACI3PM_18120 [Lactiplantibacillus plantarum]